MSFVWKADQPLLSEEEIARRVHEVSLSRNLDELATVLALMCIRQESNFWCPWNRKDPSSEKYDHDSESDDGRSVGYLQQQNKVPGENPTGPGENWWGPMSCRMDLRCAVGTFLERLDGDYTTVTNANQANDFVQRVQGSGVPFAYAKHWDYCWGLLHRALDGGVINPPAPPAVKPRPSIERNPGWRGDPVWLPSVLRAFGVDVEEFPGWLERGHGDFGKISWVLWHHTGNRNETNEGIAFHPSLGLAANMLVHPDGHTVLTGVGVAWHGGMGIYPGIPEDGINQVSIGIECAHSGVHGDPWPAVQMQTMINIGAAIEWFLGLPESNEIAHKEWAGAENPLGINKQGKPDPIDMDMDWFRGQIAARAAQGPTGGTGEGFLMALNDQQQQELYDWMQWLAAPETGELRKLFASRSPYRRDSKRLDTVAGFGLNVDGMKHAEQVEQGARDGLAEDVADVERVARGDGEPMVTKEVTAYWQQRAQNLVDELHSKE